MTSQTIAAGNIYRLTLTVDEAFLTDPNTVYPVEIDPELKVSDNTHGAGAIEDVNIYEGTPNANADWKYMHVGYYDDTYGVGRILVRLTGLINDEDYQSVEADEILTAYFYLKEATGKAAANINLYPHRGNSNWTESSVTWNTAGHTVGDLVTTVSHPRNDWGCYDITSLILDWKNGTNNPNSGFVLRHSSEDTKTKGFYSSEYSSNTSYRPYFVLTYNEIVPEIYITSTQNDVDERAELPLTAITSPAGQEITWTTSNSHVASVDDGTVTGNYAGKVTITATLSNGASDSYTVYVTVADSYYYIENAASGYCLNNYNSSSASTGTYLDTKDMTSSNHAFEVWIIKHISDGKYIIRPMSRRISCLTKDSSSNAIVKDYNIADTFSAVPLTASWTIGHNSFGYYLRSNGAESATLQPVNASELESNIVTGAWTTSLNCHWELNEAYGAYFRDRASQRTVSEDSIKYVEMGSSISYGALGYDLVIYKSVMGMQWTSSNPSVIGIHYGSGSMTINGVGLTTISVHVTMNGVVYVASFSVYVYPELSGYELEYNADIWNSVNVTPSPNLTYVYQYTNCYAYILNNQIDPVGTFFGCNASDMSINYGTYKQQPGDFYNLYCDNDGTYISLGDYETDPELIANAVEKDFEAYNETFGTELIFTRLDNLNQPCPTGTYRVALYIRPQTSTEPRDYHWYRQNSDGTWSHKRGTNPITQCDDDDAIIYDPDYAAQTVGYTIFGGYFAISAWNNYYSDVSTTTTDTLNISAFVNQVVTAVHPDELDKISVGMDIYDVIDILGPPECDIGSGTIIHQYSMIDGTKISISYDVSMSGILCVSRIIQEVVNCE